MDNWWGGGGAVNFGIVGVGLFFLLSGSLLWRNNKDAHAKSFYVKNLIKLLLPVWISYVFFAVVYFAKHGFLWDISVFQVIIPLLGGNFFTAEIQKYAGFQLLNLEGEWFTTVIIFLYLMFPALRTIFKSRFRHVFTITVAVLFIGNFYVDFLIYQNGHISLSLGLFYFWSGMYFEEYKEYISRPWISVSSFLGAIILWGMNLKAYFGNVYLPNLPIILLLYLSSFSILKSFEWMRWIGKYAYIVYLIHHTIMNWLIPMIGSEDMGIFRIGLMFMTIILLIFVVGIFEMEICKRLTKFTMEARVKREREETFL